MTTEEYWDIVKTLPSRVVTHTTQRGKLIETTVVNWAPQIAPSTVVPDQYDYVLGYNPIDQRWEPKR